MRRGNQYEHKSVESLEERLWRLAREFSELERLRLDVRAAEKMLKTRGMAATKTSKNR